MLSRALTALFFTTPLLVGETITVNSFLDLPDADLEDGVCDADLGTEGAQSTLRAAVMHANATEGADEIELPAGIYKLTRKGADEDASATGDLDVLDDLSLVGVGASTTIVDGKKAKDRILDVHAGVTFSATGVTLRKGFAHEPEENDGSTQYGGGGLRAIGATVALDAVVVSKCRSFNDGGGIEVGDSVLGLADSTVEKCKAADDGGGMDMDDAAVVTITSSTFFKNASKDEGGAIENSGSELSIGNSTFASNKAKGEGGALSLEDAATTTLRSCTLFGNKAPEGAGVAEDDDVLGDNVTVAWNSVFGDSKKANCAGIISGSGNVETGLTCDFDGTNLSEAKPLLRKAAFNGGPTRTCALLPGSPCIDAPIVVDEECPADDQRGLPRDEACDIGAFEVQPEG